MYETNLETIVLGRPEKNVIRIEIYGYLRNGISRRV